MGYQASVQIAEKMFRQPTQFVKKKKKSNASALLLLLLLPPPLTNDRQCLFDAGRYSGCKEKKVEN